MNRRAGAGADVADEVAGGGADVADEVADAGADVADAPAEVVDADVDAGADAPAEGGSAADFTQDHRPGERSAQLEHPQVAGGELADRAAAEVLHVAGGVAEVAQVVAAREVQGPPYGLPGGAEQDMAPRHAGELGEAGGGVAEVLEDLSLIHISEPTRPY